MNTPLVEDNEQLLIDLVALHPSSVKKTGSGIHHIEIRIPPSGGRCFWIVRKDGTDTDFSFHKCLQGKLAHKNTLRNACRRAILPHVVEFRSLFFATATIPTCCLTGVPLDGTNTNVDHAPPYTFDRMYKAFLVLNNIDENDPALCAHDDGITRATFADDKLRDCWVQFHNNFAQLRVISANANLTLVRQFTKDTP